MRINQPTRLADFLSGASSTVLIFAVADFHWWLIAIALFLAAIGIGFHVMEDRRMRSGKAK